MTTPAPAVTPTLALSADKAVYNVGDVITVTAEYSDASVAPVTLRLSGSASDAAGNTVAASLDVTVNTQAQQPMQIGMSDSFGDTYQLVSNDAGTAVLTATIGTPPAAS